MMRVPCLSRMMALAAAGAFFGCALAAGTEGPEEEADWERFEYAQAQMGISFRIVLYAENEAQAEHAARSAFDRVAELNQIMSDYETDSELSQLSWSAGESRRVAVSEELWQVLTAAVRLSARTGGAFDVTVGPVVNLWRKARREGALPDAERLEKALDRVGYEGIRLYPGQRAVELTKPGMWLDLGGIAKGHALDEAVKTLEEAGIKHAMVAGGGDIAVTGPPPGRPYWSVEILQAGVPESERQFLMLTNGAVATSGDLFQFLEMDGVRYSHVVDPRTGLGLTNQVLVTVVAASGERADSLATAAGVLGVEKGLLLLEETEFVEGRMVRKNGSDGGGVQVESTRGWGKTVEGEE